MPRPSSHPMVATKKHRVQQPSPASSSTSNSSSWCRHSALLGRRMAWLTMLAGVSIVTHSHPVSGASLTTISPVSAGRVSDGTWQIEAGVERPYKLFGSVDLSAFSNISLTESTSFCDNTAVGSTALYSFSSGNKNALANFNVPSQAGVLYICLDTEHQGIESLLQFQTFVTAEEDDSEDIPVGVRIALICLLLCLSGLFSGLNLGLMALATEELEVVMKVGSEQERQYAKKIHPFRKRGNLLLCTVLLGNVLVNTVLTLLLDTLVGGIYAIVFATLGIVIFGEIIPQAICTRHGLKVGAKTIPIIIFFMAITFVIAYPVSKVLDVLLGDELGTVYNRRHLVEMLRVQDKRNDLDKDEVEIVTGALTYADRCVSDIMTDLDDVYMLASTAILDFKTISDIFARGHSRIPVYEGQRQNIVGILFMKELAFVDPDDCTELSTIVKFYKHKLAFVDDDTRLDSLLEMFIKGRSHMIICQRIVDPGDGRDIYRKNVGVVTLEDVIEEIIQAEIVDETDVIIDNRSKSRVQSLTAAPGLYPKELEGTHDSEPEAPKLSEQMALAAFTFLSVNVPGFDESFVSKPILRKLINRQDCAIVIDADSTPEERVIYTFGEQVNRFVLVLEGKLKVVVGSENFSFDAGPFSTLGTSALSTGGLAISDFSAVVQSDTARIVVISKLLYGEAIKATKLGQVQKKDSPYLTRSKRIATEIAEQQRSQNASASPELDSRATIVANPTMEVDLDEDTKVASESLV